MYVSHYVFYKVDYPNGEAWVHSVVLRTFYAPQEENSVTRDMRKDGYKTLRVRDDIYRIIEAAMAH